MEKEIEAVLAAITNNTLPAEIKPLFMETISAISNFEKFSKEGIKKRATDCRNNLQEIRRIAGDLRKKILELKKQPKQ